MAEPARHDDPSPDDLDSWQPRRGPLAGIVEQIELELADQPQPDRRGQGVGRWLRRGAYRAWRLVLVLYALGVCAFVARLVSLYAPGASAHPLITIYALTVTGFIALRFLMSLLYRPCTASGPLPTISVVIPAMNEEDCIIDTIEAVLEQQYPAELLSVYVIDDGSTDDTWSRIRKATKGPRGHQVCAARFSHNRGKRVAMAAGIMMSQSEMVCFVDSDSLLAPDALREIVRPFHRPTVAAVTGHADVANPGAGLVARLQQARYFVAFRVAKAAESLSGAVTCASGCFSAYEREALLDILPVWQRQTFLGRESTFGDDRSLTNLLLQAGYRVQYQSTACCVTAVPHRMRGFLRQQVRWKKSWTRESLVTLRFVWQRSPLVSLPIALSVLFTLSAPVMLARAMVWRPVAEGISPSVYLIGLYSMALLYALYYGIRTHAADWWAGIAFPFLYVSVLAWQVYWAIATVHRSGWGTRAIPARAREMPFRVDELIEPRRVDRPVRSVLRLAPGAYAGAGGPGEQSYWGRLGVGVLALVVSLVPFAAFATLDPTGTVIAHDTLPARVPVGQLQPADRELVSSEPVAWSNRVAVVAMPRVSDVPWDRGAMSSQHLANTLTLLEHGGVHTVTVDDIARWKRREAALPANAVALVFPADRLTVDSSAPVLRQGGMRASLFVSEGAYARLPLTQLSPERLRALRRDGWAIGMQASAGAHSIASSPYARSQTPFLGGLEYDARIRQYESYVEFAGRVRYELRAAKRASGRLTGTTAQAFLWPSEASLAARNANGMRVRDIVNDAAERVYDVVLDWPATGDRSFELDSQYAHEPVEVLSVEVHQQPQSVYRILASASP